MHPKHIKERNNHIDDVSFVKGQNKSNLYDTISKTE